MVGLDYNVLVLMSEVRYLQILTISVLFLSVCINTFIC